MGDAHENVGFSSEKTDHKGDKREPAKRKIVVPSQLQSRKFWLALAVLASSTVAMFTGHVDPAQWMDSLMAVFGVYAVANTASKFQRKQTK